MLSGCRIKSGMTILTLFTAPSTLNHESGWTDRPQPDQRENMILTDDRGRRDRYAHLWLVFMVGLSLSIGSCATLPSPAPSPEQCLEMEGRRIDAAPVRQHLQTLDGQTVTLAEFIAQCRRLFPACVLYPKFYCWKSEIKQMEAHTARGTVRHSVRVYYNLMSTCYPDKIDPGRTHGDVAEFYNQKGEFMGLAVYMGAGLYCPLPYSRYKGSHSLFEVVAQGRGQRLP